MATKKRKPDKVAASMIIYDGAKMTPEGRRKIVQWLRSRASYFEKHSALLSPVFRQRYLYTPR